MNLEGDILDVHDENGREVFVTQEDRVKRYTALTGKLKLEKFLRGVSHVASIWFLITVI